VSIIACADEGVTHYEHGEDGAAKLSAEIKNGMLLELQVRSFNLWNGQDLRMEKTPRR